MQQTVEAKRNQINEIEDQMERIKAASAEMSNSFTDSHFTLNVAGSVNHHYLDPDLIFTEANVIHFLAELEEFIGLLITEWAHREKKADAPYSALNLDNLEEKQFDKEKIHIDAPNVNEAGMDD